jgi:hypothetical protein
VEEKMLYADAAMEERERQRAEAEAEEEGSREVCVKPYPGVC